MSRTESRAPNKKELPSKSGAPGSQSGSQSGKQAVDSYIAAFPASTQKLLKQMRRAVHAAAPGVSEKIAYQVPTFQLAGKNLVHFAGYEKHIGFYPGPSAIAAFAADLVGLKQAKGSVQFPIGQPLPLELVGRMVAFRVAEQSATAHGRTAKVVPQPGAAASVPKPARKSRAKILTAKTGRK